MTPRRWVVLRRTSQGLFLATLVGLFLLAPFSDPASAASAFAARLSPTLALAAMLAHRTLVIAFWPALILALSSLFVGRAFCGWACPVGTMLDGVDAVAARLRRPREGGRGRASRLSWLVLAAVLVLALFGIPLAGWLDPLSLFSRSLATGAIPILEGDPVPAAAAPLGVLAVLAVILALDLYRRRFFCRHLCPTGALLSLGARVAPLRFSVDAASCRTCSDCRHDCRTGAIRDARGETDFARCVLCMSCLRACGSRTVGFFPGGRPRLPDLDTLSPRPDRRVFLAGAGAGVLGGAALLWAESRTRPPPSPLPRIRPPGAGAEARFLDLCLRCGACVRACPTEGLAPLPLAAGLTSLWTPVLVSRKGHCDWTCHRCAQACPSGAIALLPPAERLRTVIGIAELDRSKCLPWASGIPCAVCLRICPVQPRAIEMGEGNPPRPRVLADLCVGCGLCEKVCPVAGPGAIPIREVAGRSGPRA